MPTSSVMPTIQEIPDDARLGLTAEQSALLQLACEGHHIIADGPGGSGKTTVLTRYAALRASTDASKTAVLAISPDANSPLSEHANTVAPDKTAHLLTEANTLHQAGKKLTLIVDEHTSFSYQLAANISLFSQVIIAGDRAQGGYANQSRLAQRTAIALGAHRISSTTLWRSNNPELFATLNAYAYQSRYESIGFASEAAIDPVRTHIGPRGAIPAATDIGLRVLRHAQQNPHSRLLALVAKPNDQAIIFAILAAVDASLKAPPRLRFVHPSTVEGTETDILLAATESLDASTDPQAIEKLAFVMPGRPRYRVELRRSRNTSSPGTRITADLWLPAFLHWTLDPTAQDGAHPTYGGLIAHARTKNLRVQPALTHLIVTDTKTGAAQLLVNLFDGQLRPSLHRAIAAAAKRWRVATLFPTELAPKMFATTMLPVPSQRLQTAPTAAIEQNPEHQAAT